MVQSPGNLAIGLRTVLRTYQLSQGARRGAPRVAILLLNGFNVNSPLTSAYRTFLRYNSIEVVFVDTSGSNTAMLSTLNPRPTIVNAVTDVANAVCTIADGILLRSATREYIVPTVGSLS